MRLPLTGAVIVALSLAGCGTVRESRFNPFNWFQRAESVETQAVGVVPDRPEDPRVLVARVTGLAVERYSGGAIVRATGLPPTQGWWEAELVPENGGEPVDGVMTYRFVVAPPLGETRVSTPQSREIVVARSISNAKLPRVRQIVVIGAENQLTTRR
ncbi:hypothetical protein LV82_01273 [Albidovulum inexpectatum]|uniref:Lipoprotein n=1 Tax=Albidovulum inexpectatum TaxID=196587 RepID=A0A2S5JI77_9RHOB|nr:hypothetical protein [Albidovulum inexpectatum]PPB81227.1 hypothetical protein LV82_01273 [Albidovulum inexpectatum]